MHAEGNSYSAQSEPARIRTLLESFFIELHRHDNPLHEWKDRVVFYVNSETQETVKRLLHELRQIETRLLINTHRLDKSGFFQNSEPAEAQEFAYQKWIHGLIEAVETELNAAREKQPSPDTRKRLDGMRPEARAVA